ncbi:hypothetical protein [Holophaga foetida]|uniref:hypothetical protein n=1 Tax=Holophaga foetida TaxID=35839 RepID=UPI00024725C1|nr:hypothetical protein [Holophaga foetida]
MNPYSCPNCRIDIRQSVAKSDIARVKSMTDDTNPSLRQVSPEPCALCACLIGQVCKSHGLTPDSPRVADLICTRVEHYRKAINAESGGLSSIPPRLLAANLDGIPEPIRNILDKMDFVKRLRREFGIPALGLGLSAKARSGKSSALAALAVYRCRSAAMHHAVRNTVGDDRTRIVWLDWPGVALKVNADRTCGEVEHLLEWAGKAQLLILDDIGLEGGVNWPNGDPKTSTLLLQSLIRLRHDHGAPTWWTTNGTAKEIIARYGDAVADRLMALAPLHKLDLPPHPGNEI